MAYTSSAKEKKTGKSVRLSVEDLHFSIASEEQETSGTNETKQTFSLDVIYAVNYTEGLLQIHLIELENATETETSDKKTLTNIRPQDTKWVLREFQFTAVVDESFVTQLSSIALPKKDEFKQTQIFVVTNPTSGLRAADSYYKNIVKPMLITAGFTESNISKMLTESEGKTRDVAEALGKRIEANGTGGPTPIIISMGGDGTLHEVINGLKDAGGHFRLGVIPAGSGNAFALGLNIESVEQATLKIIQGQKEKPFYLMDVKFGHSNSTPWQDHVEYDETKKPFRLLVVMSWGFHAQIVSKARYLRYFMGNKRFSLVAMFLLKFLQQYQGELVLKNAKKYNPETKLFEEGKDVQLDGTSENGFTYFIVSKQHSLEKGFKIAPFASSLTEDMDVVLLRGADADTLTKASIKAFQGGTHVESKDIEYFKTTDLLLRVKDKAELCLDGEIHSLPAQGIVHLKVIGSSSLQSTFTVFV